MRGNKKPIFSVALIRFIELYVCVWRAMVEEEARCDMFSLLSLPLRQQSIWKIDNLLVVWVAMTEKFRGELSLIHDVSMMKVGEKALKNYKLHD